MKSFAELTEAIAGVDRDLAVLQCMRAELSLQLADEEQVVLKLATIREKLEGWADGKDVGVNDDEADLIDMIRPMIEDCGRSASMPTRGTQITLDSLSFTSSPAATGVCMVNTGPQRGYSSTWAPIPMRLTPTVPVHWSS